MLICTFLYFILLELTSSPSIGEKDIDNDVESSQHNRKHRKPYNPSFKHIMASLPSRQAGHNHNLTTQSVRRKKRAAKGRRYGTLMGMLVRKSSLLLGEEQKVVGKVSPQDLEDLQMEEDPLLQMEALKALPTPIAGKKIIR